jgi:hypothetical protein
MGRVIDGKWFPLGSLQRKIQRGRVRDIVVLDGGVVGCILRLFSKLLLLGIGNL